jgi:dTDP-4-dehydrorhamnose 3,5-epimerase
MVGVTLLRPKRHGDARGWFMETYSEKAALSAGIDARFVQDNQSFSAIAGTLRGIHFQRPPHAQAKLVRCVRGAIIDYAVDLRRGSPTYGQYLAVELTEAGGEQLFIPAGYGHAFITLGPDVEVAYKVTDLYAPDCDGGVAWNDPTIGIDWPLPPTGPSLSEKDKALPMLEGFDSPFEYDGVPFTLTEAS